MKRKISTVISLSLTFAIIIAAQLAAQRKINDEEKPLSSTVFSIGFKLHYAFWDPVWRRMEPGQTTKVMYSLYGASDVTFKQTSSFLYNPVISFRLGKRWSLSMSYSYGRFTGIRGYAYTLPTTLGVNALPTHSVTHNINSDKHDADILFNCALTGWMKIYFGPKYQSYIMKDSINTQLAVSNMPTWIYRPWEFHNKMLFHSFGMGLGFAFTAHIVQNLYLLPNVSGILLIGKDYSGDTSQFATFFYNLFGGFDMSANRNNYALIGGIGSLSFAYIIPAAHLTIDAGIRAQYLYYTERPKKNISKKYELFWGPYVGVVASF